MKDEICHGDKFLGAITEDLDDLYAEHECQTVIKAEQSQRQLCFPIVAHAVH